MNESAISSASNAPLTPFKFLHYYEEIDAPAFAGRDREILEIADASMNAPTLLLYGKSGLGKTSLLLAGVFPELRRRTCLPVHIRTLQHPISDLCREVMRVYAAQDAPSSREQISKPSTIHDALRTLSVEHPVVLVLDQFEEFFIRFRGQRNVYEDFISTIGTIVNDRSLRVHVVFSLREEYLADLDDFRSNVPHLFENEYRLRPLTAFGVRQAITRPLTLSGTPFDPRLVTSLVDRLAKESFDSVVLQILCQEVFEHALLRQDEDFRLSKEDLLIAQDIDGVFRRYLDETTKSLPVDKHLHARVVLRALTTQERTKQALRLTDFTKTVYRLAEAEIIQILATLEQHKLVRVDDRGEDRWYELTHERLVPILDAWLRHDPDFNALVAA